MSRLCLAILIVSLFMTVNSAAGRGALSDPSDRAGYWEFSLQSRYTGSHEYVGAAGSRLSLEDDLGGGFDIAYNLTEQFGVGLLASWRTVGYSAHLVNRDDPTRSVHWSDWMDTANLALHGTWNVLARRFTPYVQGSVGWALVDSNIPEEVQVDCWWDPWWGNICAASGHTYSKDAASFAVGPGLSMQVTDRFLIRAGYEKSWIDIKGADNFDMVRLDLGVLFR